ncbi:hypothetical protein [Sphingomonas sp. 37zxx]|uniref:hypothetical protein n=1 Tax=Sphingomonas sp. 37zxx TaxID=1550073 RepID=UPI00053BD943|nr:hypothetical protein [Sphingomonas sp. 37zxx]
MISAAAIVIAAGLASYVYSADAERGVGTVVVPSAAPITLSQMPPFGAATPTVDPSVDAYDEDAQPPPELLPPEVMAIQPPIMATPEQIAREKKRQAEAPPWDSDE